MADAVIQTDPLNPSEFVQQAVAALFDVFNVDTMIGTRVASDVQSKGAVYAAVVALATTLAVKIGQGIVAVEEPFAPFLAGLATPMVANMFGSEVDALAFGKRANSDGRNAAATAMVEAFVGAMTAGAAEPSVPTDEGAKRLAAAGLHATLEGWFQGALTEVLSDILPEIGPHFTSFTKLPEDVIRTLGIGRLIRRAFQPLVNATAVEPMRWFANEKYRPTKLGTGTIVRELARGKMSYDEAYTILTREGYADPYIDALINEAQKFLSAAELDLLGRTGTLDQGAIVQHLRDAGWTEELAGTVYSLERLKRIETFERAMADLAITAYAEHRIDGATLDAYTHGTTIDDQHGAQLRELAEAKRTLLRRELTSAEAKACVLAGVLPMSDYRSALERERYAPDAADALEMLLRFEQDKKSTVATHAAQMAAEKAAAAKVKADAAVAKKAEIDAARAVKRLGPISELTHAVVRGLIPINRLEQVLTADFDTDTVAIYVADVEQQRADYLVAQKKAADAAKRATAKGLPMATLDQAALDHVLTVDQVGAQLTARGMATADVAVVLATLRVRVADHDAALKKREEAATKAAVKHIDLAKFEQLVIRGHRTLQDYRQLLSTLGYDEASQAAMSELLSLKLAGKKTAVTTRQTLAAANPTKGLTLAQFRRAVLIGVNTLDQFQTFLVSEGYTADAQATLTTELRDDVAAADAARTRRQQVASGPDAIGLPLATVTRAARLGLLTPAAYQAELTARGYSADDVALELDLLTSEIAQTHAVRATLPTSAAVTAPKGLTLAELTRAVKLGEAPIEQFTARAAELGYSAADAVTMTHVLADEVATLELAKQRHVQIDGELAARSLSLATVEKAVVDGLQTLDQFETWVKNNGYGAADAGLLHALLETKLPAAPGG